ncbi:hypothetical protein K7X08_001477 [Anisodus acutangulus]|uniref:BAG domain-containing protein n=1 Tax=Anisodus acutangulus TaxID=402998 RepID=A0A9Q1MNT5_9SOLA|nr:hypothetical protein K7X08_001477 [Anisodus acutangulus]
MGLLLKLDLVPGVDPTVRELRRDASRRIVGLQEILDAVSDTKIQNWDGFLMDWDDVVERMEMEVCKERGGDGNELETFCAEHLGFRCLQRKLDKALMHIFPPVPFSVKSSITNQGCEIRISRKI